jgi:hypothetical protein
LSPTTPGATRSPVDITLAPASGTDDSTTATAEPSEAPSALDFNFGDATFSITDDFFSSFREGDDGTPADQVSTPSPTSVNDESSPASEPTESMDEGLDVTQADPSSIEPIQDDFFSSKDDDDYYSSSSPTASLGLWVAVAAVGSLFWMM